MKRRVVRIALAGLFVLACCLVFVPVRTGWGKTAPPANTAGQAREVTGILDRLEKQVSGIEAQIKAGKGNNREHARELGEILQLLDFVEKEAKSTLSNDGDLERRAAALRARVKALVGKLEKDADSEPGEEVEFSRRRFSMFSGKPKAKAPAARIVASPRRALRAGQKLTIPGPPTPFPQVEDFNREAYAHLDENPFVPVADDPLSTFSIDVDTASYSNLRRLLKEGRREIPRGAIRIEEMVNYFRYRYNQPGKGHPLAMDVETTGCPWAPEHRLARVALQARTLGLDERQPSNLVFLIDSSGSMRSADKIDLLKEAYKLLIGNLDERDKVAIVTYAGSAGLVLPSTTANNRITLKFAVEKLSAGGTTAGGAGIELAYKTARENFIEEGNNRVILATDGDFNVGISSESELVDLVKEEAKSGVFLTVLGFGTGNYQDARMEALSNHGNGNYAYIDGMREARKVFLTDLTGTLYTIAKDVKFQIEFNPAYVQSYRLIGYENRQLADRDFADDKKDAGEVGSGHQVTALYELVPAGIGKDAAVTGKLRYQKPRDVVEKTELMQIKVRYKYPDGEKSTEFTQAVSIPEEWKAMTFAKASNNTRFAAVVAAFGMILRGSEHKGDANMDWVYKTALNALDQDTGGYRSGFCDMVRQARDIKAGPEKPSDPKPPPERPVPVPM